MALNFTQAFGYNEDLANNGVWCDIGEGASIKVGKLGTVAYQKSVMKHSRKHASQIRNERLSPEAMIEINAATFADCVLLDWRGIQVQDDSGTLVDLPYNRENCLFLLRNNAFRSLVEEKASDNELFQNSIIDVDADSKNLLTTSSGSSNMEVTN